MTTEIPTRVRSCRGSQRNIERIIYWNMSRVPHLTRFNSLAPWVRRWWKPLTLPRACRKKMGAVDEHIDDTEVTLNCCQSFNKLSITATLIKPFFINNDYIVINNPIQKCFGWKKFTPDATKSWIENSSCN